MSNRTFRGFRNAATGLLLLIASSFFFSHSDTAEREDSSPSSSRIGALTPKPKVHELLSQLPLSFEPATRSSGKNTKFLSRQSGYGLAVSATEAVFALGTAERKSNNHDARNGLSSQTSTVHRQSLPQKQLRFRLFGANLKASARGVDPLPERRNYFIGNDPQKWRRIIGPATAFAEDSVDEPSTSGSLN